MLPLAAGTFTPAAPGGHPASWVATGRSGGVSAAPFDALNLADHVGDDPEAVTENRARVAALTGGGIERTAFLGAVHGGAVALAVDGGVHPGVDGLVTDRADLVLVALAADCVPIALADPDAGVLAVAHCGWRGLGAGIVEATVEAMRARGARSITAVLGPSICATCYPVPPERIATVRREVDTDVADVACREGSIDVSAGVEAQLRTLHVPSMSLGICTAEDARCFSYRRDVRTGRHGMIVWR